MSVLGSSLSSGAARRRARIRHQAPEDDIADAPLEAPQRLLTRFALRDLLAVVGPAPSVRPGLADGDHVQGVVELAVPGQREPVAHHLPAGGLHRRRAGVGGEVGLGREPRHVADRPDDLRGQYGTYAEDLGEGGTGSFYLGFYAPVQVRDLSIQRTDVAQDLRSQPPAEAGRGALRPYAAQDACGPVGRKRSGYPAGDEVPQKPVQAVERPGTLGHQVLAPLVKQAQHLRGGLGIDRRQPLVARGGQGGSEGVEPVVLAGVAAREHPHPRRKLRRHVHHGFAGRCQPPCQVPTEAAGVLHRPTTLGEPFRPALEGPQAFSRFCRKLARSTSSPTASSTTATATDALWGSTPIKTFMSARTSVFGRTSLPWARAKDIPTSGRALSYLF